MNSQRELAREFYTAEGVGLDRTGNLWNLINTFTDNRTLKTQPVQIYNMLKMRFCHLRAT